MGRRGVAFFLLCAALAGCNEDLALPSSRDGYASVVHDPVCAENGDSARCIAFAGCSWLHLGSGYRCFETACTLECARLTRISCLSCFGCDWLPNSNACVASPDQSDQSPCDAASDASVCHARSNCAWITTQTGSRCIVGHEGPPP